MIWVSSVLFLVLSPAVYTSSWALILPGSVNSVNVTLPEIGQATASRGSAGGASSTFEPRANYQYIFSSEEVIRQAAKNAKIPAKRFSEPRIKNIDNTTIMQIEVTGPSPEEARRKSYALYDSFRQRLNELRTSEMEQREVPTQSILRDTQAKLVAAQRRVSAYKLSSGISSIDQVESLSSNIEDLRRDRAQFASKQAQAEGKAIKLSRSLNLSAAEAADAFKLQVDQIFQQNLKNYSEATAILRVESSKFGPSHPRIRREVSRQKAALQGLQRRAHQLLSRPISANLLSRLALAISGSGREALFQSLVTDQSEATGAAAQVGKLDQQIRSLEARLRLMTQKSMVLENLMRDEQIAQAVFASTLAKLDLGQGDLFGAFPLVQLAVEPSLALKPTSPRKGLVIVGAFLGTVLTTVGLWVLWIRKPWVKRIANWIST
ncbi:GumC family protein [Cyanobium sp. N5-Cardenillas]|uniref:GumC family protein n=1 Tax=Cyanobium sp. N5-Cardenillas TaxID=2823720 RepID=UPI0020CEE64C|nr:hypothetical protein [Cyanobium sp. N5-Cardenillas]